MKSRTLLAAFWGIFIILLLWVSAAFAHPLGNFTVNHYAGLQISQEAIVIDYVLDMAEIPAFQEITEFDANGNDQPDATETAPYHPTQCEFIRSSLVLSLNGEPVNITLGTSGIEFPPGVGGLVTLRLTCTFNAAIAPINNAVQLNFQDNSYTDRLGWREIVVTGNGITPQGDFATTSVSNRLTAYPNDLLQVPLDQREISLTVSPGGGLGETAVQPTNVTGTEDNLAPLVLIGMVVVFLILAVGIVYLGRRRKTG